MTDQVCNVTQPTSLKEALDFTAALNSNHADLKKRVGEELKKRSKNDGELKKSFITVFEDVLNYLRTLRAKIVKDNEKTKYGNYSDITNHGSNSHHSSEDCVNKVTAIFVSLLHPLLVTLNYMLPYVQKNYTYASFGRWKDQPCDGHGNDKPDSHETLNDFLTDYKGQFDHKGTFDTILPGGYNGYKSTLSDNKGSELEKPLQKLLGYNTQDIDYACLRLLVDALGLLSHNINTVLVSTAAVLGTLGLGGAAAVATNFMGLGTLVYGFLGLL
ncbi:hybrid sensor histidine kinase/response regulator [Babesia caballi]|uniref:Hybrid sensor histidine kinase/response regulator n=1 Tax=Babesia caballi TaxID=5871 RepID=A0AAV4LRB2_BABCB|nr:hybrid sensor histidine kinase/response regulator [Babesia caballi]